jgi:iron uptake system EfeUOB component EfeO/EfeM
MKVVHVVLAVVVAAVVAGGALALVNRGSDPKAPAVRPHVAIAPATSTPGRDGKVFGTTMSPQQAADAVIEDGVHPDLVPLKASDFDAPVSRYRRYARGQAEAMITASAALQRAARHHDAPAARRAWAESFDRWLLVGAAYGALGDLDAQITGALERLQSHPTDTKAAGSLAAGARRLPDAVSKAQVDPLTYATRAHEILEDVQRDDWSNSSGVRATADGVAATRAVIGTLQDVLAGRGDVLQQVDTRLTQLEATLRVIKRQYGEWPAPQQLATADRERLTGSLGAALEALAGVPGALETRLPPTIPAIR